MNKIFTFPILAAAALSASAATSFTSEWPSGAVTGQSVERADRSLIVGMTIHPDRFIRKSNLETWVRPAIVAGSDTLWLDPVVVAGRTRYHQHLRNRVLPEGTTMVRSGSREPVSYQTVVPYQEWMELSELMVTGSVEGCCGSNRGDLDDLALETMDYRDKTLHPVMVYVSPTKEIVKMRSVSGEAFIDFPVSKTQIIPDYRRNPAELAEIRRTIDAVREDRDITITSLSFKGYASPEGPYDINEKLASGRTEALIDYVAKLYDFPRDVMHSSYVAEDWAGLRKYVESSSLPDTAGLLAVIDETSLAPDAREWRLKKNYPEQYAYLLAEVYPGLRRCDYQVTYQVRSYADVEEIAAVMATAPQKLSLDELFLYAGSLDRNSPEFREVMEVAVRMYPDSTEANLNAATTAVAFGDFEKAARYLSRAGSSPVATYTRGVIEAQQGRYSTALPLLEQASREGVAEAADLLEFINRMGLAD